MVRDGGALSQIGRALRETRVHSEMEEHREKQVVLSEMKGLSEKCGGVA